MVSTLMEIRRMTDGAECNFDSVKKMANEWSLFSSMISSLRYDREYPIIDHQHGRLNWFVSWVTFVAQDQIRQFIITINIVPIAVPIPRAQSPRLKPPCNQSPKPPLLSTATIPPLSSQPMTSLPWAQAISLPTSSS